MLHYAALWTDTDIITNLLDLGIDVNARDKSKMTPAHIACSFGRLEVVKLLLHHGANLTACSNDGTTSLHCLAHSGINLQYMEMGVCYSENMHIPLSETSISQILEIAKLLIEHGVDPMACDNDGNTALHYIAEFGATNIAVQFLDLGININARNKIMQTPALVAAANNYWKVVRLLLEHGADPMACDNDCNTLLHHAAKYRATDIIIQLLNKGISVDIRNKSMDTAADIASRYGSVDIVNLLLASGARTTSNTYDNILLM